MIAGVTRWGLPLAIVAAGLVVLAASGGSDTMLGLGLVLIGIGPIVALWNGFLRLSLSSEEDREREQRARRYFSRHGRWPRERR